MIERMTEKTRANLSKEGSVLKKIRIYGGIPMAIMAGGVAMLVCMVFLCGLLIIMGAPEAGYAFGILPGIPGLLMILGGAAAKNKQKKGYLDYYKKTTGFGVEEIKTVDSELMGPDAIIISGPLLNKGTKGLSMACFITEHYFVVPLAAGTSYVRRIQDLVAVFYSDEIPGINGYKHGMGFISRRDDAPGCHAVLTKEPYMEAVQILSQRNPRMITDQKFLYEGKIYDLWKNSLDVIQLFEQQMSNETRS